MNKFDLLPSVNWNISHLLVINETGDTCAYGSRCDIIVLKNANCNSFKELENKIISRAHKNARVMGLSFVKYKIEDQLTELLASCGDDGRIKIWNYNYGHTTHETVLKMNPATPLKLVDIDYFSQTSCIVSIAENGCAVKWDLNQNKVWIYNVPVKSLLSCVAVCPHTADLIAVGTRFGRVIIFSVKGEGKLIHTLLCHNSDVTSVSWCPVPYNVFQLNKMPKEGKSDVLHFEKNDKTFLLASCCSDLTIYISRAGTDNHCETLIKLPPKPVINITRFGQKRNLNAERGRSLKWIYPLIIVTFTDFNEMIFLHLSKFDSKTSLVQDKQMARSMRVAHMKYDLKLIHNVHKKSISSFAVFLNDPDEIDFKVWSYSADRLIVRSGYKKNFREKPMSLPLVSGFIFCLDISPTNPDLLAIGTGDGKINVWNLSTENFIDITTLSKKIDHKVMSIQWHPFYEGVFAFGTYEGRVGLFDISQGSTTPTLFKTYHQKAVYRLCWAPPIYIDNSDIQHENKNKFRDILSLFAVVDGDVLQYNPNNFDELPINLTQEVFFEYDKKCETCSITKTRLCNNCKNKSDMCYEINRKIIVFGCKTGEVRLFSVHSLKLLHVITDQAKPIMSLMWHPNVVFDSPNGKSPCSDWLAVASENVSVYNIEGENSPKKVASLEMHNARILHVAWSPHTSGRLVTCSGDNTAIIWDVMNQAVIGRYTRHCAQVLCGIWSQTNKDIVITGSSDFTCRMWSVSKDTISTLGKDTKKHIKVIEPTIINISKSIESGEKSSSTKYLKNQTFFPTISHEFHDSFLLDQIFEDAISKHDPEYGKFVNGKCKKYNPHQNESVNTVDSSSESQDFTSDESSLVSKMSRKHPQKKSIQYEYNYSNIFGTKEQLTNLIKQEERVLEYNGSTDVYILIQARFDLKTKICEAIEKNQVTEYLIALAASISPKLWRQACLVYIEQMIHEDRIFDAVNFQLALGLVKEAVELLCEKKRFKEAFTIARLRFEEDELFVKDVLEKWIHFCFLSGSYRLGAHCYMYLKEEEKASGLLSRSKHPSDAFLAAKLLKFYQPERAVELAADCLKKNLLHLSLDNVQEIFNVFPEIKFMKPWYFSVKYFTEETPNTASIVKWVIGWFKDDTCNILTDFITLNEHVNYEKLRNMIADNTFQMNYDELIWYVSAQVALYLSSINCFSKKTALRHFIRALSHCYNFKVMNSNQIYSDKAYPMMRLLRLMFPAGIQENFNKALFIYDESDKLQKSINAYFCDFIVMWLAVCNELPKSLKNLNVENANMFKLDTPENSKFSLDFLSKPSESEEKLFNNESIKDERTDLITKLENPNRKIINKDINESQQINFDVQDVLDIIQNKNRKLQKICELFTFFLDDVLDENTVKYFKNVFEIKKYETDSVNSESKNKHDEIKFQSKITENKKHNYKNKDLFSELNFVENSININQTDADKNMEENVFFNNNYTLSNILGLNSNFDSRHLNYSDFEEISSKSNVLSIENLKILQKEIENFEKERISAPNPFIFVYVIRDFLSKYKNFEPELVLKLETMLLRVAEKCGIIKNRED